jgi:hypothetical protein
MIFHQDDPATWWPNRRPLMIAHDVGSSCDRSTAVVGVMNPFQPELLGIPELIELPQGLVGSARASALAEVDLRYDRNAMIIADLSYDPTYAEVLHATFGPRVIGLHIGRSGNGMDFERRQVSRNAAVMVYHVGRSYLLELLRTRLQEGLVRMVDDPMSRRAYAQLMALETEMRESGTIYKCASGQHDDLGISCAMLAWAARHPHLEPWVRTGLAGRRPRMRGSEYGWGAFNR